MMLRFVVDVSVKGDITVCGEVIEKRGPFHGWWRKLTKGNTTGFGFGPPNMPQLLFIDTIDQENIKVTSFGGTLAYTFEFPDPTNSIDILPVIKVNDRVLCFEVDASQTRTVNGVTGTYPDDFNFYFTLQEDGEFNGLAFLSIAPTARNNQFPFTNGTLFEKLDFDMAVGDQIRPWGNGDNAFENANSRRFMFEQIDQTFFENNNSSFSPAGLAERLMPRQERITLRDAILNEGVERDPVNLFDINKTTKGSGTTTLFVIETYPFVNFASKVTLSGLEGDWASLNGQHQVAGIYNTDNETVEEQAPFYQADTRLYHILIIADTTGKPDFDPAIHAPMGAVMQPAQVGPITEDIEHREWVDAAIYYGQRVLQQSNHSRLASFVESLGFGFADTIDARLTKPPLATWQDVSATLAGDIPASFQGYVFKGWFGSTICPTFYLPFWEAFFNTQINEPFEALGIPGSSLFPFFFPPYAVGTLPILGFNVPFENYLLPESRRWLYFRVKPDTPVIDELQENVWVLGYDGGGNLIPPLRGYASVGPDGLNTMGQLGGSRLEGLMSPVPWGASDATIEDGFWSPFSIIPTDPTAFNAGIINPELVGGRRIGYIEFIANIFFDPFFVGMLVNFGDPALALSPDPELRKRQQYDGSTAVMAELMRYFVEEQQVEAIIIDNRIDAGGNTIPTLVESFGGARLGSTNPAAFVAQDNRDAFNLAEEIDTFSGTRADNRTIRKLADTTPWPTVRPDLQELRYPGSVFKNGPVIILDSQYAGSGGDWFPRFFMGDNLDGDIGNGVTAKIVGTIDGILEGAGDINRDMVRSKFGSEFPTEIAGEIVGASPIIPGGENNGYFNIAGVPTLTRLSPDSGFTQPIPALVPVNSNLVGPMYLASNTGVPMVVLGALSTNLRDTVYFDFGFTGAGESVDGTPFAAGHWDNPPIGIDQVGGFPGQPDPNDPSTLRDSWFEEAIRVARLCLGDIITKSVPTKSGHRSHKPSAVVEQCAEQYKTLEDVEAHCKMKERMKEGFMMAER